MDMENILVWLARGCGLFFNKSHSYDAAVSLLFYINTHSWRHTPFSCCWQQLLLHVRKDKDKEAIIYSHVDKDNANTKLTFKVH